MWGEETVPSLSLGLKGSWIDGGMETGGGKVGTFRGEKSHE